MRQTSRKDDDVVESKWKQRRETGEDSEPGGEEDESQEKIDDGSEQ